MTRSQLDDLLDPDHDATELSVDDMVAAVVQTDPAPTTAPEGRRPGRASVHTPAPWDASRLLDRPAWHGPTAPPEVAAAWEAVVAQADAVDAALEVFERIKADQAAERSKVAEVARRRADGDVRAKAPAATDWTHEKSIRAEVHRVALRQLRQARGAYDRAVVQALPTWRDDLLDLAAQQADALRAEAAELAQRVATWRTTVQGAEEVTQALHPDEAMPQMQKAPGALAAQAVVGVQALAALLEQDDEVFSGRALRSVGGPPTDYARRRLLEGGASGHSQLVALEVSEQYAVSTYTLTAEERAAHERGDSIPERQWNGARWA